MQSGAEALAVEAQAGVVIDAVDKSFGPWRPSTASRSTSRAGEFVAVVGPERLRQVHAAGARLRPHRARRRDGVAPPAALMPQRDALLPWPSALDNAALALRVAGVSRAEARAAAHEHFAAFGLEGFEPRGPPRCRAGCASASRSCARCWPAAPCSASTSRSARSTRSPGSHCSAGSPTRSRASRARSCSSRTTSRRPCCWPTASCSSRRARAGSPSCSTSTLPRPRARDDAAVVALRERALEVLGRAVTAALIVLAAARRLGARRPRRRRRPR